MSVSLSRQREAIHALLRFQRNGMHKSVRESEQAQIRSDAEAAIRTLSWLEMMPEVKSILASKRDAV